MCPQGTHYTNTPPSHSDWTTAKPITTSSLGIVSGILGLRRQGAHKKGQV